MVAQSRRQQRVFASSLRRRIVKPGRLVSVVVPAVVFVVFSLTMPRRVFTQEADLATRISNTINGARQWLDGKLSTPGTSATLRERERSSQENQLKVSYNLMVEGASKDQNYVLISWPINSAKPIEQLKGVSIGADGIVVCAGKTSEQCVGEKENDPVNLVFLPQPGEIVRLALVSSDQKIKVFAAAVPDPIVSRSSPCSLEVIRLMPRFALAFIRAKGYASNETLTFNSKSYNESHQQDVKADGEGNAVWGMLPAVKDKKRGTTNVSAKGGSCTSSISFDWGE